VILNKEAHNILKLIADEMIVVCMWKT